MKAEYAYVWEYIVDADHVEQFLAAYGPEGEWVQLFRGREGYVRTELLRDRGNPLKFMTIDYWATAGSWQTFRREMAGEFEALDKKCEAYTVHEKQLGLFEPVA